MTLRDCRSGLIAAVLGGLLLYGLGWRDRMQAGERQDFVVAAQAALQIGKAGRAQRAKLAAIAAAATARAHAAAARAAAPDTAVGRLTRELAAATTVRDSNRLLVVEVHTLEAQVADWRQAYAALIVADRADSTRAAQAEARIAVLEPLVQRGAQLAQCRILGFGPPCPSRTTTFILGAVAGFVASKL